MKKLYFPRWNLKKVSIPRMPKLRMMQKILLYLGTALFAVLALADVVLGLFPYAVGIAVYVMAAITLFSSVYYLVGDFRHEYKDVVKPKVTSNPYVGKLTSDFRLRTFTFAVPSIIGNLVFAISNAVTGIYSHSAWFGSLAAYYILLSLMRISAVRQDKIISTLDDKAESMKREIAVYKKDSILFIFLAIVLAGMVVLLEFSQGGKEYPGLMIYVAALYVCIKAVTSSVNIAKGEKQGSPLLAIVRRIGYVDAYVSILTLQTAMFAAFAQGEETLIKVMNALTGGFVCILVLGMGINGMISKKKWDSSL